MSAKQFALLVGAVLVGFYVVKKLGDKTSAFIDATTAPKAS